MAKTNTERQARYRATRNSAGENGERRLATIVSTATHCALGRLARQQGVTRRAIIEMLIQSADVQISDSLDSAEADEYFKVTA
jgi:hypothetical protein